MTDLIFSLKPMGFPGSRDNPVLYQNEKIGMGEISASGYTARLILDPGLSIERRQEVLSMFRDGSRVIGNYNSGDVELPDGSKLGCEGSIQIYSL